MRCLEYNEESGNPHPDGELNSPPINLHVVYLKWVNSEPPVHQKSEERDLLTDMIIYAKSDSNPVRRPLIVEESYEETALSDGRVSYYDQLADDYRVCGSHR